MVEASPRQRALGGAALVAEVAFAEWTPDGQIRHASYVALRTDKPASAIVRETATTLAQMLAP